MTLLGFDIISDLNLSDSDSFNWESKPTSLYCIIAGNVSDDITVIYKTIKHLSKCYQGVFYIEGSREHKVLYDRDNKISEISKICLGFKNVVFLHNNVVVVDGIALLGVNGWGSYPSETDNDKFQTKVYRYDDLIYLEKTVEKLQLHIDVKKIIIISSSVPSVAMYFGENPKNVMDDVSLDTVLSSDTEHKIKYWIFGSYEKIVDTIRNDINYISNPYYNRNPYYARRIDIEI